MKEIQLTQGYVAIIDDEDYEYLWQFKWHVYVGPRTCYARRAVNLGHNKILHPLMHRELLAAPAGIEVDHRDGNGLNNVRLNLRLATHGQNCRNKRPHRDKVFAPTLRGVSKLKGRWRAQIIADSKYFHLGYFDTELQAALAYNEAAKRLHGDFARLNDL